MVPLCPRTLIKWLEKIDPRKMEHEEQLCFWINIHNALVMHAFMAYGLQEKCIAQFYTQFSFAYSSFSGVPFLITTKTHR
ncbi:hypothetical protein SETIT_7G001700v2 [Setaria italica]|uniref:DUF547 domain-containing protein n=1 Tax=Setaria italica TaxID=4555 RepID=K3YC33_SETIT|nr:hypothetical protein SETIT_7G001700v2 [Setaria italica]